MQKLLSVVLLILLIIATLTGCQTKSPEVSVKNTIDTGVQTYCEMSDGTWQCDGRSYQYRLEISGRTPQAAVDSTFVYLSNLEEIPFEQAWKAAGFSSSSDDYFPRKTRFLWNGEQNNPHHLPKRKNRRSQGRACFVFIVYHSQFPRLAQPDKWPYSRCTPLASQASIISLDQTAACTSPICTLLSISMQIRDCPMPPPMVRGSCPSNSILWNGSSARIRSLLWPAVLSAPFRPPGSPWRKSLPPGSKAGTIPGYRR